MSTSSRTTRTELARAGLGAVGHILPDAMLLVTRSGTITEANHAAGRVLGRDAPSLVGTALAELVSPHSREQVPSLVDRFSRSGSLVPGSLSLPDANGRALDFRIEGAALGAAGSPILLVLRSRESTGTRFRLLSEKIDELAAEVASRRRAESMLEHQRQILELIVTDAPLEAVLERLVRLAETHGSPGLLASVLLLDGDGTHLLCGAAPSLPVEYNAAIDNLAIGPNVGSCGSAAYLNEPVIARDIEHDPRWRDYRELALSHGLRACWSTPIPSSTGSVLGTFALYYREPMDPPPVDRQVVMSASRIASIAIERRREEEQIESLLERETAARAEAEAANRAKDEFLALISHELRNPLNAILGWTRLLQIEELDGATSRQGIETIERNVLLQSQLIEDMLDFSRVSSGQLKLELKPTSITEAVREAVSSMLPDADSAGLTLDFQALGEVTARCDRARLHQVVTNLISNSIKFTPRGGRVSTRVERTDGLARITVKDDGEGIRPEFLPYVFDPFRQADASYARPHSGLGLGLAVVRRIAELHGGRVSAHSEGEGKGSTFVVELPVEPAPAAEARPRESRPTVDLDGLRVLVVEDEADSRELIGTILRLRGAQVSQAASAAEAFALLDADASPSGAAAFDVLVSDIAMPGVDGYSLIEAVRARGDVHATMPAIALTAYARDTDRAKAYAAGFDHHLPKPVEPDRLLTTLAELSRSSRSQGP